MAKSIISFIAIIAILIIFTGLALWPILFGVTLIMFKDISNWWICLFIAINIINILVLKGLIEA